MLKKIQVFKAGRYGDTAGRIWNNDEVKQVADNFNPDFRRAPVKLGHEGFFDNEKPAVGWVKSLEFNNGILEANVNFVDSEIKNIKDKYINVSVEAVKNIETYDLNTDLRGPYLLGVALLGSSQPAVAGLEPVKFSNENDKKAENFYLAPENVENPLLNFDNKKENATISKSNEAERKKMQELEKFKKENGELQTKLQEFIQKEHKAKVETFISKNNKKILPAVKDEMLEFALELNKAQLEKFEKIVEKMPELQIFKSDLDGTEEPENKKVDTVVDEAIKDLEAYKKLNG